MSVTMPNPTYVPTATRRWAIATLVLAILMFLLSVPGFFRISQSYAMLGSKATFNLILQIAGFITAGAFIAGSIATLKGLEWGRETVAMTAAAAMVQIVLSAGLQWSLWHDPHWINTFTATMSKNSNGSMSSSQLQSMTSTIVLASLVATIVMSLIQITYCALLYRHMSADPPEQAAYGDPGAWPPAPSA